MSYEDEKEEVLKEKVLNENLDIENTEEAERLGVKGQERALRKLIDPRLPTEEERLERGKTHIPYRNWCPHCVKGRGKDLDHRRCVEQERGLSEYAFDYCFPGDEFGFKLTI